MWVRLCPAKAREMFGGRHDSLLLDGRDRSHPALGHQGRVSSEGAALHGAGVLQEVHVEDRGKIQVQPHESHLLSGQARVPTHGLGTLSAQDLGIGNLGKGRSQAGDRSSLLIYGEKKRPPEFLDGEALDIPVEPGDLLGRDDVAPKKDQTGRLDRAKMVGQGRIQLLTEETDHYELRDPLLQFHDSSSPEIDYFVRRHQGRRHKLSRHRRDKARESLPAAGRLRNEAYIDVRGNDER
jgi:hypothetical protein